MILILDMGNTTISIGAYRDDKLVKSYKTSVNIDKTLDEYVSTFYMFYYQNGFDKDTFTDALMSSVVPSLNSIISTAVQKVFDVKPRLVGPGVKTGMPIRIDNPSELGADLVSDGVAAVKKYGAPAIICDLGTANKIIYINDRGEFEGCTIAPGFMLSLKALIKNTSLLTNTSLKTPRTVIGKNTIDSMNAGMIAGTKHLILGICDDIERETGTKPFRILTGGNATYLRESLPDFIYDEDLTLDGIYFIYKRNLNRR